MGQITVSQRFQAVIDKCISDVGGSPTTFIPTVVLHQDEDEYSMTLYEINRFWIKQDFINKYTDVMFLEFDLTYDEYVEYSRHVNGLKCTIKLEFYNTKTQQKVFSEPDIIFKNLIVVTNEEDLNQKYNANMMQSSEDNKVKDTPQKAQAQVRVPIYLMEESVFKTRHLQLNGIMSDVDSEQMLRWAISQLGIEKVNIAPPDNKQKYNNFIVPPGSDIKTIFQYYQDKCGVYYDGIGWYVTGDTCYVYPQYATATNRTSVGGTIHIAHCPEGEYRGLTHYHAYIDNDIYILSNTGLNRKSLNTEGLDKVGGVHMVGIADGRHDNSVVIGEDGSVKRDPSNIQAIGTVANNQPMADAPIVKFDGYTNNVYASTSKMAASNGVIMKLGWNMALLQALKPGQGVVFHYDDEGSTYTTKKGRIMSANFDSVLTRISDTRTFGMHFICELTLFLEPDTITNDADTTMGG